MWGLGTKFLTCEVPCGKNPSSKTLQLLKLILLLFRSKILLENFSEHTLFRPCELSQCMNSAHITEGSGKNTKSLRKTRMSRKIRLVEFLERGRFVHMKDSESPHFRLNSLSSAFCSFGFFKLCFKSISRG